jgi:hypothetical protein
MCRFSFPVWPFLLMFILPTLAGCKRAACRYAEIDHQRNFSYQCSGDLLVDGRIDGQSVGSLTSHHGNITIKGRIDGQSTVTISAKNDVKIEGKIDGASVVRISCGGNIIVTDKIDGASDCDLNTVRGSVRIVRIGNPETRVRYHSRSSIVMEGPNDASPVRY